MIKPGESRADTKGSYPQMAQIDSDVRGRLVLRHCLELGSLGDMATLKVAMLFAVLAVHMPTQSVGMAPED